MIENKKVAVMLANGFEEIEALSIVDIMRRANIKCDMVSIKNEMVNGSHGIIVKADKNIKNIEKYSYDMIVLPGGLPGADYLRDCDELITWIKDFAVKQDKYIAAICAAPQVLAKANVIKGKRVTSYPGSVFYDILKEGKYSDDLVVVDGNIITSRGPATAIPFAYKLLEVLGVNVEGLKKGMLYNELWKNINK